MEFSTAVGLIGRRAAALYAGIAVMFFMARNAEPSTARTALIYGIITACMILACLGVYELTTGHATRGILAAVLIEIVLSLLFMVVCRSDSKSITETAMPRAKPTGNENYESTYLKALW